MVGGHAVHDPLVRNASPPGRSDAEIEKGELAARMGVGPDRDSHADLAGEIEQLCVEVLPVGVAVYLDRPVVVAGAFEDPSPVSLQARAKVEDAASRMGKDVSPHFPDDRAG